MDPRTRRNLAWGLLIVSLVLWPITAFTLFIHEPQGILGLSWFAIILTAVDILCTTDVREKEEE